MPRTTSATQGLQRAVGSLAAAIASLVERLGTTVSGTGPGTGRGPGKGNPRLKAALKASWARMTAAERRARVAKMLAGRGLKPKRAATKATTKRRARGSRKGTGAAVDEPPVPPSIVI